MIFPQKSYPIVIYYPSININLKNTLLSSTNQIFSKYKKNNPYHFYHPLPYRITFRRHQLRKTIPPLLNHIIILLMKFNRRITFSPKHIPRSPNTLPQTISIPCLHLIFDHINIFSTLYQLPFPLSNSSVHLTQVVYHPF